MARLQVAQLLQQVVALHAGLLDQALLLDDVETASPAAAGSGSDTCDVTWRKPLAKQSSSIAAVVIVAASGMPPPSVFDTATKSGTTPSCSKPNIVPSRPKPVCASSMTSSIPRSSQSSRRRAK